MKRKGFTLIELLAVLVIVVILILIAVPIVRDVIKTAKKNALMDSAHGLLEVGRVYYSKNAEDIEDYVFFKINNDKVTDENNNASEDIKYKGTVKHAGLAITADEEMSVCVDDGKGLMAVKTCDDEEIKAVEGYCENTFNSDNCAINHVITHY